MKELTREQKIFLAGFMTSCQWYNWEYIELQDKSGTDEENIWNDIEEYYDDYINKLANY